MAFGLTAVPNHLTLSILHLIFVLVSLGNPSSDDTAALDYITTYKEMAVMEMHRTGVPASITMAQALHESNKGMSSLATRANNHFGIKCKRYWKGGKYYHKDDDLDEKGNLMESCFRSYDSAIDSYVDHSNFLKYGENYLALFMLSRTDYVGWAYGLKRSGYATDPRYAEKLVNLIEKYQLYELDVAENPNNVGRTYK